MPLAVVKTNLKAGEIPERFCLEFEDYICEIFDCDQSLAMVEIHPGLVMSRNQSTEPLVNVEFHHHEPAINTETTKDFAGKFASFLVHQLNISLERILVIFTDTRCTTLEATTL